ncbi:unnamed protein product [Fusarium venenatum]|uniref:DUF6546 domain-containing protein n=1 Tax=Fusarium venenatum TaxID=56646 RepID=A0A2L2T830_9HYPO|nr:uncharacterized protein FVRRES_02610 [Fusarium venenatum]CEI66098.1 unnamed protein product [Fusarium venenatum]
MDMRPYEFAISGLDKTRRRQHPTPTRRHGEGGIVNATLVPWTGDIGIACAFVYMKGEKYVEINWRGTWDLDIGHHVMDAWNDVVTFHGVELRTTTPKRITEVIMSYGDAIYHELPCQVIQPTSLWQIRVENQYTTPPIRA